MRRVGNVMVHRRAVLDRTLCFGAASAVIAAAYPPLAPVAVLALGLIAAVLIVGVSAIGSGIFLRTLCCADGRRDEIALTFDDGPDPEFTPRVLATLAEADARATFFLVGRRVADHPDLVARIVAEGHELGMHSYDHAKSYPLRGPRAVREDLIRVSEAFRRANVPVPRWFRPPNGLLTPPIAQEVTRAGLTVVGWTVRPMDGVTIKPSVLIERVVRRLRPGAVVALHDARSIHDPAHTPAAADALPEILRAIRARGLLPVTISTLHRTHCVEEPREFRRVRPEAARRAAGGEWAA